MILKSKVLNSFQGVAYGHMTLEAMQNWHLSKIDLLVREVVQNCSDAADKFPNRDFFSVAFNVHEFDGKRFIDTLEGLDEKIKKRFSLTNSKYLEIRDGGTTGLTGPLTVSSENENDHGNYYRLVFDTGKAQTQKYSGGNWGYGKSAYYGVGQGFVIYYSQIKNEIDEYESRLIVTLIENEENENAILRGHINGSNSAGKAWWGKSLDGEGLDANILPLQNETEINEYLDIFGIKPFKKGETGTSVIIPYVDYSELMTNMISEEMEVLPDIKDRCAWTYVDEEGFIEYLKLSIQKWYAPVINNLDLPKLPERKKWLYASVNGELINYDSMYPFFQLTQRLYTAALTRSYGCNNESKTKWSPLYENTINSISIRNYIDNSGDGNTVVGYLATAKIPQNQVNIDQGENLTPFILLGYYEEFDSRSPIVMYSRRLGMVIDYAYKDEWVHGIPLPEDENEYVFSFFVPCLGENKRLKKNLSVKKYAGKTLEEYLISCEASDHEGWEDHDRMTIVSSIQKRVSDSIKNLIRGDILPQNGSNADRLGNAFSKMINISKGKLGRSFSDKRNDHGGSSTSKKLRFESEIYEFGGNRQVLKFLLECKNGVKNISVNPILFSDGSNMHCLEWEKDIRSKFPVEFSEVRIMKITTKGETINYDAILSTRGTKAIEDKLKYSLCHEIKAGKTSQGLTKLYISFDKPITDSVVLEGTISLATLGTEYEYDIVASEDMR